MLQQQNPTAVIKATSQDVSTATYPNGSSMTTIDCSNELHTNMTPTCVASSGATATTKAEALQFGPHPTFQRSQMHSYDPDGYANEMFTYPSNCGTYIRWGERYGDCVLTTHAVESGVTISVGETAVIQEAESSQRREQERQLCCPVEAFEAKHQRAVPEGSIVALKTLHFTSADNKNDTPTVVVGHVDDDLIEAVLKRNPKGIVVDRDALHTTDAARNASWIARIVSAGIFVVLNASLSAKEMPETNFFFFALPLKIADEAQLPVRLVAVVFGHEKVGVSSATVKDLTQTITPEAPFFPGGYQYMCCPYKRHRGPHFHSVRECPQTCGSKMEEDNGKKERQEPVGDHHTDSASPASATGKLFIHGNDLGTHVDSPSHFYKDARSVSDLHLAEMIVPLFVIDVSDKCAVNPDYAVTLEDFEAWEAKHVIAAGSAETPAGSAINLANSLVCVRSGWGRYFSTNPKKYLGMTEEDGAEILHFPGFSNELAEKLLSRGVAGIGIDTLSLDVGISTEFPVHCTMLGGNKYQVENMLLDGLPETGLHVAVLPLRVQKAFECCSRVVAFAVELQSSGEQEEAMAAQEETNSGGGGVCVVS